MESFIEDIANDPDENSLPDVDSEADIRFKNNLSFLSINLVDRTKIIIDGIDVTPLPLCADDDELLNLLGKSNLQKLTQCSIKSNVVNDINNTVNVSEIDLDVIKIPSETATESRFKESSLCKMSTVNSTTPLLQKTSLKMSFPKEITILLEETETVFLFEMPSISVEKGTPEGDAVKEDNKLYEYLTIGKGRNRKKITTETQTEECILKTRFTMVPKIEMKNSYAFASTWDMFDSFAEKENSTQIIEDKQETMPQLKFDDESDLCQDTESEIELKKDIILTNITKNSRFTDSVIIMERVLANNVFKTQQEYFKGISEQNNTDGKNLYLVYLWTFDCEKTQGKSITALSWNTQNEDILAVGYGKYYYTEKTDGIVAVWSIKNPIQPERLYNFTMPVTSMEFSIKNPNLLAVGFYNGDVLILDIISYDKNIIAKSDRSTCPSYRPIWQVKWYCTDLLNDRELVITTGQDGRINEFTHNKTGVFQCNQIMRINRMTDLIKNEQDKDQNSNNDIPIVQNPPCLVFCYHPTIKDIYFIGTMDGCIYKCTTNCFNMHLDLLVAHDGPVYGMQFSYFCQKIFVTCGADWTVKIWIEDIRNPLLVLKAVDPVEGVAFHPTHSTIVAAISDVNIYLWDLKNSHCMLLTKMKMSSDVSRLTRIKFTSNGRNLIISDIVGGVHVYNMSNMIEPTTNETDVLYDALRQALAIKPELLKKFNKMIKSDYMLI